MMARKVLYVNMLVCKFLSTQTTCQCSQSRVLLEAISVILSHTVNKKGENPFFQLLRSFIRTASGLLMLVSSEIPGFVRAAHSPHLHINLCFV